MKILPKYSYFDRSTEYLVYPISMSQFSMIATNIIFQGMIRKRVINDENAVLNDPLLTTSRENKYKLRTTSQ